MKASVFKVHFTYIYAAINTAYFKEINFLKQYNCNCFDKDGTLIYIGKAKSLKKRVSSYLSKKHFKNRKTAVMVSCICNIEFTLVESEIDG